MLASAELADWGGILALVFGGCMSNAAALEQCTMLLPNAGSLLTFSAFVGVSLCFLPSQLTLTRRGPRLRAPQVPLSRWAVLVAMFFTTNWMNNLAFAFRVPMPIHIIFRSGGLVVNMIVGYTVVGKTYNALQVLSVLLVSGGITLSTLSAGHKSEGGTVSPEANTKYVLGIGLLAASLLLSGFMGLWQERTFLIYGRGRWKESLFYTHFLALPLFLLLTPSLQHEVRAARATPGFTLPLLANSVTQIVCIAGVNRLTTKVSSVSVVMILAVRKAASLALSVAWAYSRGAAVPDPARLWMGTAMVLLGTVAYAHASSPTYRSHGRPKEKAEAEGADSVSSEKVDGSSSSLAPIQRHRQRQRAKA